MRRIILCIVALFIMPALSQADSWCQWDGEQGINCQSDSRGYIRVDGFKVSTPSIANAGGYYRVDNIDPVVGENQVRDEIAWSFSDNVITRTWTVRDLTAEEIDQRVASPMPLNTYYIWKALIAKGVITQQEAAQRLPQELIDAYLARDRLEDQ